jgi:hypothetical protein
MTRGVLRSCAAHGRNFWLAYGGRSFGGQFFCPGYVRDDLFRGFDPRPYRPLVMGEREGDHVVRLISGGWPMPNTAMCVIERRGDLLMVRPLGLPDAALREVPVAACWPHRYVAPSQNRCWS